MKDHYDFSKMKGKKTLTLNILNSPSRFVLTAIRLTISKH